MISKCTLLNTFEGCVVESHNVEEVAEFNGSCIRHICFYELSPTEELHHERAHTQNPRQISSQHVVLQVRVPQVTVLKSHPEFKVGEILQGVIVNWSDTQLAGLEAVVGE